MLFLGVIRLFKLKSDKVRSTFQDAKNINTFEVVKTIVVLQEMYPSDHRVDYFPKGPFTGSVVKITPKPNCVPR